MDEKTVLSILNKLRKIFDEEKIGRDYVPEGFTTGNFYPDPSQITGITFNDKTLEKAFVRVFNFDPELKMKAPKTKYSATACFPISYLKAIINCFENDEFVFIQLKDDSPVRIAGKNYGFHLAHRIADEEKRKQCGIIKEKEGENGSKMRNSQNR